MKLNEDVLYPYVGFTTPVYLTKEDVIELVQELSMLSHMVDIGYEKVSKSDAFIYKMLVANNILIKEENDNV